MAQHRIRTILTAGTLLAVLALTSGCSLLPKEEEEPAPAIAAPVKSEKTTYTVRHGSIQDKISLRATYAPVQNQELSFRNGGRVRAVYVQAGEKVQAGQVLAELYSDDAEYQLAQARIRIEKAKLGVADAQYKLQYNQSPATQSELKRQELELQSAELDVNRYARLVADARVTAPFAGQIMSLDVKPGDQVAGYQEVIVLADPGKLWIEADVDDAQLARLAVGMKTQLDFNDAPDATTGVVVDLPDPKARATSAQSKKVIRVQPDQQSTKATMAIIGKVHVILQEKQDVLLLDSAAVRRFSNRTYVLMKEPRREVDVTTGIEAEKEIEIVRGLKEGDEVIGR